MDPFFKNSLLFRKKIFGSMLDPQRKPGVVRTTKPSHALTVVILKCLICAYARFNERKCFLFQMRSGYDGLGGRTKFIQPVSFSFCLVDYMCPTGVS